MNRKQKSRLKEAERKAASPDRQNSGPAKLNMNDEAARKIQTRFRIWRARKTLREKAMKIYVKVFDRKKNLYVYRNKETGQILFSKPKVLGNSDLPTPRKYIAPFDYNPGETDDEGYALIVSVNSFISQRIKPISPATKNDVDTIETILTHNFVCKLKPEHVITLKDPTCENLMDTFSRLSNLCKTTGFLFVYISTHVMTVSKGESKGIGVKKENSYFCMKDTSWVNAKEAAATSVSLTNFCDALETIGCSRKTVCVNYAFAPKPARSFFKTRFLYPPSDFLSRLATMGNCVAIGCCNIGTPVHDIIRYTPKPYHLRNTTTKNAHRIQDMDPWTKATLLSPYTDTYSWLRFIWYSYTKKSLNHQQVAAFDDLDMSAHDTSIAAQSNISHSNILISQKDFEAQVKKRLFSDWQVEDNSVLSFQHSKYPEKLVPKCTMISKGEYSVEIPSRKEVTDTIQYNTIHLLIYIEKILTISIIILSSYCEF